MKDIHRRDSADSSAQKGKRSGSSKILKDVILKFIHLRYHPPGLILQYFDCQGRTREKVVELLDLNYSSSVPRISSQILKREPLLFSTLNHRVALVDALNKLKAKCLHDYGKRFMKQYSFYPHTSPVTAMCLSKDGKSCITTSNAANVCSVWDLGGMRETAILQGHTKPITAVSFSHLADKALTGSEDGTLRLWELCNSGGGGGDASSSSTKTGTRCLTKLTVNKEKILCATPSSDFSMTAAGCSDNTAYVHDLANGIAMYKFNEAHSSDITNINFDTSGSTLLSSATDGTAALWDLRSGNLISMLQGHTGEITKSLFDHLCQLVATCSTDTTVRLWDMRMMGGGGALRPPKSRLPSLLHEFTDNEDEVLCINFDSRGSYIASGAKDGSLTSWDVKTGNRQFHMRDAHDGPIRKVQWSPNGGLVMTASEDKTVNLFHPDMATCFQTLSHHKGAVTNAFFSYSNEYLVTAGEDRNVFVYRLERALKSLKNGPFVLTQQMTKL